MPPAEITFGRLSTVDLSDIGKKVSDNVRAAGWGDTVWSVTENGALLIRAANMTVLSGADFEKQSAFLKTDKPEQISRTFLDNSGLTDTQKESRGIGIESTRKRLEALCNGSLQISSDATGTRAVILIPVKNRR